ncbi:MAG: polysaccharide biosynthesis tyrosine autokinase [Clostridiales bacterium]|jgi:capsular exopolysaccharide synthesis family protein|nr:polysaccharide biosynthesis tyrosine autokinase [Clostridiales bacterium]
MDDVKEISIEQLVKLLLKNKLLIIISTVVCLIIAFTVTSFVMKKKYESIVKLYVYTPVTGTQNASQDLSALNYAQKVVNTYIQMLNTRAFREEIRAITQLGYTQVQLTEMISFSALDETEVFQARVVSTSPEDSVEIAMAIANVAPDVIKSIQESSNLKIVDPPVLNNIPVSPNMNQNLAIGLLAGLAGSVLFIFLRDMFDNKIKTSEDLSEQHNISVLAEVTDIGKAERNKKIVRNAPVVSNGEKYQIDKSCQEAYRTARTNLAFSLIKKGCKKVAVVSSVSKEGKTTTSINLAISLSQQIGVKVLLVDCDLRKPRLHHFFDMPSVPGLSDYLCGLNALDEVLRETHIQNLSFISSGTGPPNPAELLSSNAFVSFVESVQDNYDYIIFDTSPINLVVDALEVIKRCDSVVLTAIQGVSLHPEFEITVSKVKSANALVAGVVLHGVESSRKKYYSGDKEYYNYYY